MRMLVRPILSLLCACLLLLGISAVLKGTAEENAQRKRLSAMTALLPGSTTFTPEAYSDADENITAVYRGKGGCIVESTVEGYVDSIVIWTGVRDNGSISGLAVREMRETRGLGSRAASEERFLKQFIGKTGALTLGETVDAVSGATVTSKAIVRGVNSAIAYVTGADIDTTPTKWGEWS